MNSIKQIIIPLLTCFLSLKIISVNSAEPAKTNFEAVTAKLDRNGHLLAYFNTAKTMKQLDQMMDSLIEIANSSDSANPLANNPFLGPMVSGITEAIKPAYEESGIGQIGGVGMSSLAVKKDQWRQKTFIYREPEKSNGLIWEMFGSEPHSLEILELAPAQTGLLAHSDLRISALMDWIDRISEKVTGGQSVMASAPAEFKDILNAFDDEVGFLMTIDPNKQLKIPGFMIQAEEDLEMDSFAFALIARTKGDKILSIINEAMEGGFAPPQKTKIKGVNLNSIPLPLPIPIEGLDISPCYFQVDDYMVLASSTSLGKSIIEAKNGKGQITENDDFKTLTEGLDLTSNGISYVSSNFTEWSIKLNELSMGQMPKELKDSFNIYLEYNKQIKGMVSLIKSEKDGIMFETRSSVNLTGEYLAHTAASIAIILGNSVQQFNESGMFDDLGGFE
ncbi:MAG: hypothetical protein EVA72_06255 [Limisphaerales bacterium]|nr:MAG: hypothetical protein EVA72_06255 [Limisphaerales bacterium]|tara:strand:+ start:866 stop:2209 length:1344 start_codon:yes stop_codon:yes gene_type:complete